MKVSAERLDHLLEEAAMAAGLSGAAAAEANAAVYQAWAPAPRAELGHLSPAQYAGSLPLPDLLTYLDDSARVRDGHVARLWADELVGRLRREAPEGGPVLGALTDRALYEPDDPLSPTCVARGALSVLGRWAGPGAVPVLMSALVSNLPGIRGAAAAALGQVGLPALAPLQAALGRTRDPVLQAALYDALSRLPGSAQVAVALREAWAAAAPGSRAWLAEGVGRYGDPAMAPLVAAELATGAGGRAGWALCRVALHRLGATAPTVPLPPPRPDDPDGDLLAGTRTLAEGGLAALAREWAREGLALLAGQEEASPGAVDWFVYEQFQALADQLLGRPPEVALHRYVDYCYGALHYYGALKLEHLISAVSLAGLTSPPAPEVLWAALKADGRFAVYPARLVALPLVENAGALLEHREELGAGPALIPLRSMALAARGLAEQAWYGQEEEAAAALLQLLPPALAQPGRVADLQMAMRGARVAVDAFREWLSVALSQGMEPDKSLKDALVDLWNHTARWELFGHAPWAAREMMSLAAARGEGRAGPNSPCPCGSGKKYRHCCGRR